MNGLDILGATSWEPAPGIDAVRAGSAVLRKNMRGPAVGAVQRLLGVAVDDEFGSDTETAVKKFQSAHVDLGVGASGVIGADTLKLLEGGSALSTALVKKDTPAEKVDVNRGGTPWWQIGLVALGAGLIAYGLTGGGE